jgi:hypothetical protein
VITEESSDGVADDGLEFGADGDIDGLVDVDCGKSRLLIVANSDEHASKS